MFDFGADARAEGGENGQNHKGLMTMDRKYKKDSFYAYKAWLRSPEEAPFVHICSKRYIDRVEDVTKVTVYSNLPEVELFVNGESVGKQTAPDHFFRFEVKNVGESKLVAKAGELTDESVIRKVDTFNEEYRLVEKGVILNWFDIEEKPGRLSLNSKMSDVISTLRGKLFFAKIMGKMMGGKKKGEKKEKPKAMGFEITSDLMAMMGGFTVLRLLTMAGGMMNVEFTKEELLGYNKKLSRIPQPKKKKTN
jgi:beta-galactosidase